MPTLSDEVTSLDGLDLLDREDLIAMVKRMVNGGVSLSFNGKRTAMEITRKVRPRVTRRIKDLHVGSPEDQCRNLLIEGENLQAMVTLYKYRGQVDLIVTDPPYNTGQYFRYNDKWDEDPNDPELGNLVTMEDGSRHTKWMKTMLPRLQMMQAMLKPQGVIAICIDDNELFHLGQMMDEVFGEGNLILDRSRGTTSRTWNCFVAIISKRPEPGWYRGAEQHRRQGSQIRDCKAAQAYKEDHSDLVPTARRGDGSICGLGYNRSRDFGA